MTWRKERRRENICIWPLKNSHSYLSLFHLCKCGSFLFKKNRTVFAQKSLTATFLWLHRVYVVSHSHPRSAKTKGNNNNGRQAKGIRFESRKDNRRGDGPRYWDDDLNVENLKSILRNNSNANKKSSFQSNNISNLSLDAKTSNFLGKTTIKNILKAAMSTDMAKRDDTSLAIHYCRSRERGHDSELRLTTALSSSSSYHAVLLTRDDDTASLPM